MHKGLGQAHGKIILMGEHAVVYGQPAIAIPFPETTITTEVTEGQGETSIDCQFYSGIVRQMPELLESLRAAIETSIQQLNQPSTPLHITIESSIPAERGMGSSAAVAVATTRGIFSYFNQPLHTKKLLEIVAVAEKIAHGNPSGLDALMTSSSRPYFYIKNHPFEPISLQLNALLIVADTGITGQTKEAVAHVADLVKHDQRYSDKISRLGQLTNQTKQALATNQVLALGSYLNQAHHLLDQLGVSSYELDTLVKAAREAGAIGAKLTGGGRGGCMIALAENKEQAKRIIANLEENGAKQCWLYDLNGGNI